MLRIDPARLDLAREFRDRPLGPHSQDLKALLKIMRWDPVAGRIVVVQPVHDGPWYLARLSGPKGNPIEIFRHRAYASLQEAWWALFRKRWQAHTGEALALDEADHHDPLPDQGHVTLSASSRPLLGYADRFSVENGGRIEFKVHAERPGRFRATIHRLRCFDHLGPGLKSTRVETTANADYPARSQAIELGSYIEIPDADAFALASFTLIAHIWPTTPGRRRQSILGNWIDATHRGYRLGLDERGALALTIGDGARTSEASTEVPLRERHWYRVAASFDATTGHAWVAQIPLQRYARGDTTADRTSVFDVRPAAGARFRIAAWSASATVGDGTPAPSGGHYNGKIEAPVVLSRALRIDEREGFCAGSLPDVPEHGLVAAWDFSREMSGTRVLDVAPQARHGRTVNLPTRAMKGRRWDGSEYNWVHKPEHYAAIHFHDDDLYDCRWSTDFAFTVPEDLPSGLYAAHLEHGGAEDWIPFTVRPRRGQKRADLALLLPTAAYWAYANTHLGLEWGEGENVRGVFTAVDATSLFLHEHPQYGCSLYDRHSDGSGVCYSSRLRPILTMRPRERLWQLPADTHIIDWLEEKGLAYDLVTEDDLEVEGAALLRPYRCVLTGTHPEYPSLRMLDAFRTFQEAGGRFVYLGGNGFYWRTSYHPSLPGVIEMRRGEDGIRSWLAEGGEYYHSFTGELGGMWRRMGRAPQSVAGTGMTSQGFDRSTFYERTAASFDPRAAFIFEGVGAQQRIGDFGRIGGGAAGWEIDRADLALGTPPHALIVATASDFSSSYHWMKEELTHTHSAIDGETCPLVRCDMVFYETAHGGAVFSASSIAWAGALAHNGYVNNVSRITENVIRRFLDPTPL